MSAHTYQFAKGAGQGVENIIKGEDMFIGDYEYDPDMIFLNQGAGADAVKFIINQDTGIVEVKYSEPGRNGNPPYEGNNEENDEFADLGKDEDNDWYESDATVNIQLYLQTMVVKIAKGGRRKSRRNNRKSRKSTRRNRR